MSRCYLEPRDVGMTLCRRDPDKWLRVMGVMMGTPNLDWFLKPPGRKSAVGGPKAQKIRLSTDGGSDREGSRRRRRGPVSAVSVPVRGTGPLCQGVGPGPIFRLDGPPHGSAFVAGRPGRGGLFHPGFLRAHARFGSPYQIVGRWSAQRPLGSNHRGCDGKSDIHPRRRGNGNPGCRLERRRRGRSFFLHRGRGSMLRRGFPPF